MRQLYLGIDLGTTNSKAAYLDFSLPDAVYPEILQLKQHEEPGSTTEQEWVPSVVMFEKDRKSARSIGCSPANRKRQAFLFIAQAGELGADIQDRQSGHKPFAQSMVPSSDIERYTGGRVLIDSLVQDLGHHPKLVELGVRGGRRESQHHVAAAELVLNCA